ncbi:MAG: hypothetical protein QJR03_15850, partial [Sphaerobacter sp.]|nr:hypothetical protein [Sphaerobacter sp.]
LATAAGAARAVVRQITRIELLEASDTGDEQILAARGQLGTLRQRYREAQRVAEAILEGEIPHGISSMGAAFDNRGVRASVVG